MLSFEPLSEAHVKLAKNSRKDHEWIVAPRMALGSKDGTSRINISANYSSSSILNMLDEHVDGAPESVYINSEDVRRAKLDTINSDYIGKGNNIFLKIDVQGFEYQVLEGAKKTLLSVQGMEVELSLTPLYNGQMLFHDMLEYISLLGFELIDILPEFRHQKTGRLLQVNGLFFRPA